jgi:hypothetical protein
MSKITVSFPGGGGGNWLANLIHCLEHNLQPGSTDLNFHDQAKYEKSNSIALTHDTDNKNYVFFNGTALFNIYLNVVSKLRYSNQETDIFKLRCSNIQQLPFREQVEILASEGSSKLFFLEERTDIDWNDIFVNEERFVDSLYSILNSHDITYHDNRDIIKQGMINYRTSCIDPAKHFGNFNDLYWLGWCNGISKHLWQDWPLVDSIEQLQDFIKPKQEFFKEFTEQYMLNVNV